MRYVIVRNDGMYVADMRLSSNGASYTDKLQHAKVYATREAAERDRCGNETIIER